MGTQQVTSRQRTHQPNNHHYLNLSSSSNFAIIIESLSKCSEETEVFL